MGINKIKTVNKLVRTIMGDMKIVLKKPAMAPPKCAS